MKKTPTRVRLLDLEQPLPTVELPNGREIAVKPADGYTVQLGKQMIEHPEDTELMWTVARRLLPDATEDEVMGLSAAMVEGVINIATGNVDKVLAILGNAGALPGAATPAAPSEPPAPSASPASTDSSPPTPSPSSVPASPAPTDAAFATF